MTIALFLTGIGASISATAAEVTTISSKKDWVQGGKDASVAISADPSEEGIYQVYLFAKASYDQAVYAGDQSQIDYWDGYLYAVGSVVIPY